MSAVIPSTALVLVAVINNPRDLEIARLLGWYRIPFRSAPKVISVDFLAFYQTGTFGKDRWRIQYVAPVYGHELTTRAELLQTEPDHPRAKEEYFKIQVGPLIALPKPIIAEQWRRITFIYTTGEYLTQADNINDLVVRTEERQVLWKSLRERANQLGTYLSSEYQDIDLPGGVLAQLLGIKDFEYKGG